MNDPEAAAGATTAVVTVSYRSGAVLPHLLSSIDSPHQGGPFVVVADNASEVGNVRELAASFGAHYLPLPHNVGYGSAINAAVSSLPSSIEWVLIANPDSVIHAGAIDILRGVLESDDSIGAVGPQIETDGLVYPSARSVPSLRVGVGHALFANVWLDNPWSRKYKNSDALPPRRRDAGWLSGACLMVRRSLFAELNGFDEKYFMYFEDVDLGYRISRAGYRNVYEPAAVVTHTGAHSTSSESKAMIAVHHRSARLFLNTKYSAWYLFPIRLGLSWGLRLRARFATRGRTS
jgi:N-acetylglucosaminyl-diphospho-decaprenol L-rhamnosyltransferase